MYKLLRNSVLALGVMCASSALCLANDPFVGAWRVTATPNAAGATAGSDTFGEEVLFHNGQFSAGALAMLGFQETQYTTETVDGVTTFSATLTSTDRGTLVWTGHLDGRTLTGSIVWTRPDGELTRYVITGSRTEEDLVVAEEN